MTLSVATYWRNSVTCRKSHRIVPTINPETDCGQTQASCITSKRAEISRIYCMFCDFVHCITQQPALNLSHLALIRPLQNQILCQNKHPITVTLHSKLLPQFILLGFNPYQLHKVTVAYYQPRKANSSDKFFTAKAGKQGACWFVVSTFGQEGKPEGEWLFLGRLSPTGTYIKIIDKLAPEQILFRDLMRTHNLKKFKINNLNLIQDSFSAYYSQSGAVGPGNLLESLEY